MKKFIFTVASLLCFFTLFATSEQRMLYSPKLQEKYAINDNMSIQTIAETLNLPVESLKANFQLNLRDPKIDSISLKSHGISIDNVFQFYNIEKHGYNDFTKIDDVCLMLQIPFKKMAEFLEIDPQDNLNRARTIRDLGKETLEIVALEKRFHDQILDFSSTLTVLGMSVVFISLILTSLLISQLVHLGKHKKTESKPVSISTSVGTVSTEKVENLSSDAIVAVIAAIHKLKMETAKENKIILTWRRANISMWQASGKVKMPNNQFSLLKNRR